MSDDATPASPPDPPPVLPPRKKAIPLARLVEVERRLLLLEHPPDIERVLSKEWGIRRRQVRRYITLVRQRLAAAFKSIPAEQHAAKVASMLDEAFVVARSKKDPKGMVSAAKVYAEVTGVKAPQKVDVTSGGQPLPDARALLAASLARLAAEPAPGGSGPPAGDAPAQGG